MLLAIDVGNTNTGFAVFRNDEISFRFACRTDLLSSAAKAARFIRGGLPFDLRKALGGICISSVVPKMDSILRLACKNALDLDPLFVTAGNVGMNLSGYDPNQIGMDRLAGSLAAYSRYGGAVIVIDAGSGITFDAVSGNGRYLGGAIAPGLSLATRSLHEMTAKLPLVEIKRPKRAIGRSTEESIRSGIYNGYAGLIDNVVQSISKEMKGKPIVVATGGDAKLVSRLSNSIDEVYEDLVFDGIRMVFEAHLDHCDE